MKRPHTWQQRHISCWKQHIGQAGTNKTYIYATHMLVYDLFHLRNRVSPEILGPGAVGFLIKKIWKMLCVCIECESAQYPTPIYTKDMTQKIFINDATKPSYVYPSPPEKK